MVALEFAEVQPSADSSAAVGLKRRGRNNEKRVNTMDQRIGELLGRIIPLSDHDVEDILNEQQASNNKQFGDIALQLGLAKPEHILEAWLRQLETRTDRVHLSRLGVDVQAVAQLPAEVARRHAALPVRAVGDVLLLAVAAVPDAAAVAELEQSSSRRVRLVLTDAGELNVAIERYYPTRRDSAAA